MFHCPSLRIIESKYSSHSVTCRRLMHDFIHEHRHELSNELLRREIVRCVDATISHMSKPLRERFLTCCHKEDVMPHAFHALGIESSSHVSSSAVDGPRVLHAEGREDEGVAELRIEAAASPTEPLFMNVLHFSVSPSEDATKSCNVSLIEEKSEVGNRFVRAFSHMNCQFARVTFAKFAKGNSKPYRWILERGFMNADRRFTLLAVPDSALRSHKAWFIHHFGINDAKQSMMRTEKMLEQMGNFKDIDPGNVPKRISRIGLCFSTTYPVFDLRREEMHEIGDIVHEGKVFSDGCGLISESLRDSVVENLNAMGIEVKSLPSAFQIRCGGIKGLVLVDPSVQGLCYRPSMEKFKSPHTTLEIISWSSLLPASINRQFIHIMDALGVRHDDVIEKLMYNLEEIHEMMQPRKAIRWIASSPAAQHNCVFDALLRSLLAGFLPKDEPYLRQHLLKMQEKAVASAFARIRVPSSAYAFGVVDHTATLEEGEIFFHPKSSNPWHSWGGCIRGKVMVTRNPCYHPGDIRVLKAVECPALAHVENVVVFSSKGSRPECDRMSGGDYDGDGYFVSWLPDIIPDKSFPASAYAYDEPGMEDRDKIECEFLVLKPPKEVPEYPLVSAAASVFITHDKHDELGLLDYYYWTHAGLHQKHGDEDVMDEEEEEEDRHLHPAMTRKSKFFTHLLSHAVDAAKQGKYPKIPKDLIPSRDLALPDFMGKSQLNEYPSSLLVGKLHRIVKKFAADLKSEWENDPSVMDGVPLDEDLVRTGGYEQYLDMASKSHESYSRMTRELMDKKKASGLSEHEEERNRRPFATVVNDGYDEIVEVFRQQIASFQDEDTRLNVASAFYVHTYTHSKHSSSLAFPWLVACDELVTMKLRANALRRSDDDDDGTSLSRRPYVVDPTMFGSIL